MMQRLLGIALAPVLLLLAPRIAQACSVCSGASSDAVVDAFLVTTVFLSVLPLLLVGGFAWWLRRRTREPQAARAKASQPSSQHSRIRLSETRTPSSAAR